MRKPSRSRTLPLAASAGLMLLAAACSSGPTPTTFDLTAPREGARGAAIAAQIVVAEPVAVQPLDADRIIVKDASGAVSFLGGGQWADRLPRLVQARLIQTFENSSRIKAVSRPGNGVTADYQLNTEIRAFQIDARTGEAVVELSVKAVDDKTGRIRAARVFAARTPVGAVDAGNAAQGLDKSLSTVLVEIVRFVASGGAGARV